MDNKPLFAMTLVEGVEAVRSGHLKPSEWYEACVERTLRFESEIGAWEHLDFEATRKIVEGLDGKDWTQEHPDPLVAGAPLGVKDIINTIDAPTSMGSEVRKGYWPGNDARVVGQWKLLGGYVFGKTTTAEFAVHTPPKTHNPHNPDHIAGTSSTGSAVAVACGMVPVALGTQSGGSITRPSSYNGVIGFKPSFGLIPRTAVLKTCDTLDTIGWMSRSIDDAQLMLDALRVRGHNYPLVEKGFARASGRVKQRGDGPVRVAFAKVPGWDEAQEYTRAGLTEYAYQLGNRPDVELSELDLRGALAEAHEIHRKIYHKSLSYYFTREMQLPEKISDNFKEIVEEGRSITGEEFIEALDRRDDFEEKLFELTADVDVLMTPSTAGEAPLNGQPEVKDSSLIWSLCAGPSISLPILKGPNGLPIGVQLAAPRYEDYTLLEAAKTLFPETIVPLDA